MHRKSIGKPAARRVTELLLGLLNNAKPWGRNRREESVVKITIIHRIIELERIHKVN